MLALCLIIDLEDSGLQDTLFSQIQQMLRAVTTRYPEYSSNLLYVITSNYPPSENIGNLFYKPY